MDFVNCPKCGRLFQKMSEPLCPDCMKKEEELFQKVKAYLDETPTATLEELSKETGASPKKIMGYLRDGRLELVAGASNILTCMNCGAPITSGRYCNKCALDLQSSIKTMFGHDSATKESEPVTRNGVRMHTDFRRK